MYNFTIQIIYIRSVHKKYIDLKSEKVEKHRQQNVFDSIWWPAAIQYAIFPAMNTDLHIAILPTHFLSKVR